MKRLVVTIVFFTISKLAASEVLDTPSYVVNIKVRCSEGNVTCNDVLYTGTNKKSGKAIRLKGSTWHTLCADRVTPCRFVGYRFASGGTLYEVTEARDLTVRQGNKVLVDEHGQWER